MYMTTLNALLSFNPAAPSNALFGRKVVLEKRDSNFAKLLLCHDFKGGYKEHEYNGCASIDEAFRITHWHLIDTFVYFSHHLVTVPPAQWIAVAHRHGTQVLGTFIAEHEEGRQACERAFASTEAAEHTAKQLASVAELGGFEGWLINIEVALPAELTPHMLTFLRCLTSAMRDQNPSSAVLWYDAVTVDGRLQWQNTLNGWNGSFFEACDGLFTNYHWTDKTPQQVAKVAGRRANDVYMGVDVFGRGTFAGGGMRSHLAVASAQKRGLSAALFAPGWLAEGQDRPKDGRTMLQLQHDFWKDIENAIKCPRRTNRKAADPGPSDSNNDNESASEMNSDYDSELEVAPPEPLLRRELDTCFNQGCGRATFEKGKCVSRGSWYDLGRASLLPLPGGWRLFRSLDQSITTRCAFFGGSCWHVKGEVPRAAAVRMPLFLTNLKTWLPPNNADSPVVITYSVACLPRCQIYLVLHGSPQEGDGDSTMYVGPFAEGTAPSVKGNALVRAIETGVHSFESAGPEAFDAEGDATEKATQATAAAVPEVWTTYEAEISAAAWDRRHIRDIFLACTVPEDEPRGTGDDVSKSGPDCESPFDFSPDPSSDVLQSWAPFEGFIGQITIRAKEQRVDAQSSVEVT